MSDFAYPLMIHIMKIFLDLGNGDMHKTNAFDNAFRWDRVKTKNDFAHLNNSWKLFRCLRCLNFIDPYVGQIIIACCILHNFCRMNTQRLASGK